MPVETHAVGMSTYVKYDDLSFIYCGDRRHPDDYDVTSCMHPFDGIAYTYVPEERNWIPNLDAAWKVVREERDARIEAFRWRVDRQRDLIDLGLAPSESLLPFLQYMQELRDIPQTQTDPYNIIYPEEPA